MEEVQPSNGSFQYQPQEWTVRWVQRVRNQIPFLSFVDPLIKQALVDQLAKPPLEQHHISTFWANVWEGLQLVPVEDSLGKAFEIGHMPSSPLTFHEIVKVVIGNLQQR